MWMYQQYRSTHNLIKRAGRARVVGRTAGRVAIACLVACGLAGDNAAQAGPSEIDAAITQTGTVASFDGSTLHIVNEAPLVGMTFFDAHSMPASFFSGFASGRFELTGEFRDVLEPIPKPQMHYELLESDIKKPRENWDS